jgi:hypothetical protein
MARTLSVKIPTSALIADIEATIAKIDADIEAYPEKVKQYEADLLAYKSEVTKFATDYIANNADKIGFEYDSTIRLVQNHYSQSKFEIELDISVIANFPQKPVKPEQPNSNQHFGREYTTRKAILEKNLRILKMTSQEEVNASSYSSVIDLI